MLRTNLAFMNVDGEVRSVLLTSCLQGEGKSVTMANLAVTLALGGKKVIVVDADLRRPRMHSYFGLANERGVSTVVTGQTELSDSLQAVPVVPQAARQRRRASTDWASGIRRRGHRLYVLTSGPPTPNPGEIVSSKRFAGVIETLARRQTSSSSTRRPCSPSATRRRSPTRSTACCSSSSRTWCASSTLAQAREQLDKLPCTAARRHRRAAQGRQPLLRARGTTIARTRTAAARASGATAGSTPAKA